MNYRTGRTELVRPSMLGKFKSLNFESGQLFKTVSVNTIFNKVAANYRTICLPSDKSVNKKARLKIKNSYFSEVTDLRDGSASIIEIKFCFTFNDCHFYTCTFVQ